MCSLASSLTHWTVELHPFDMTIPTTHHLDDWWSCKCMYVPMHAYQVLQLITLRTTSSGIYYRPSWCCLILLYVTAEWVLVLHAWNDLLTGLRCSFLLLDFAVTYSNMILVLHAWNDLLMGLRCTQIFAVSSLSVMPNMLALPIKEHYFS
jgi:hypothetical protein